MIQKISDLFFSMVDAYMHAKYGHLKAPLLEGHPNTVVELGAGYGANFRYLHKGTHIIAIEPNEAFHGVLRRRAEQFGMTLEIFGERGESIDLEDHSQSMVLCSLVLCSVEDPPKVLAEIRRILQPGGKFVYVEHVAAAGHSWLCKLQNRLHDPWEKFFDGCQLNRDTGSTIRQASFREVTLNEFDQRTILIPIKPHIYGMAIK